MCQDEYVRLLLIIDLTPLFEPTMWLHLYNDDELTKSKMTINGRRPDCKFYIVLIIKHNSFSFFCSVFFLYSSNFSLFVYVI